MRVGAEEALAHSCTSGLTPHLYGNGFAAPMMIAGVEVNDQEVLALARLLRDAGLDDTAEALIVALEAEQELVALRLRIVARSWVRSSTLYPVSSPFATCCSPSTSGGGARGSRRGCAKGRSDCERVRRRGELAGLHAGPRSEGPQLANRTYVSRHSISLTARRNMRSRIVRGVSRRSNANTHTLATTRCSMNTASARAT